MGWGGSAQAPMQDETILHGEGQLSGCMRNIFFLHKKISLVQEEDPLLAKEDPLLVQEEDLCIATNMIFL